MGKTTKRSRKFIAKGGPTKALAKKGSSLTKKGKTKRHPKKQANSADGQRKKGTAADDDDEDRSDDFTDVAGIGQLDMDSFFEKAVGMMEKGDDGESSDDDEDDEGGDDGADGPSGSKPPKSASSIKPSKGASSEGDKDDDDEVDSLASLGSEESDIEASEARLKEQLAKLSEDDPEFHTYLKENEEDLLEFNMDDDSVDEDYEQDEDAMEEQLNKMKADDDEDADEVFAKQQRESNNFLLTPARLGQLEQSAFESHSVKGLKRIISAYKTACHLSDASQDDEASSSRKKFQITSPVVFDRLMAVVLANCHKEFHHHLFGGASKDTDSSDDDNEGEGGKAVSGMWLELELASWSFCTFSHFAAFKSLQRRSAG